MRLLAAVVAGAAAGAVAGSVAVRRRVTVEAGWRRAFAHTHDGRLRRLEDLHGWAHLTHERDR